MKTRTCFIGAFALVACLQFTLQTNASSQSTITILGSKTQVVQYDTGGTNPVKQYQRNIHYEVGRDTGYVQLNPRSRNDTWRTIVEFWLPGSGVIRGSTINNAILIVTVGGSTYNAKIVAIDTSQNMVSLENIWLNVGQSSTTYFNVPYGTLGQSFSSAQLKTAVQNHVYNGMFRVGIMSLSESQEGSATTASVNLQVNYTPPAGKISVQNSFGSGRLAVDADTNVTSGQQYTWSGGSQHILGAVDQEWPAASGKQRTFNDAADKGWKKIDASNPFPGITLTTSHSFTYTVIAGESATLEAQFKTGITVSGTMTIAGGTMYKIEAPATVNCLPGSKIVVNGALQAVGRSDAQIVFTSPTGESWQGIEFNGDGGSVNGSSLQYCDIKYATTPIKTTNKPNLYLYLVTVGNSNFYNGIDNAAMAFYNSSPVIYGVVITGNPDVYPSTNASWNGVRFAEGSRGEMSSTIVQNCGRGNGVVVQGHPVLSFSTTSSKTIIIMASCFRAAVALLCSITIPRQTAPDPTPALRSTMQALPLGTTYQPVTMWDSI